MEISVLNCVVYIVSVLAVDVLVYLAIGYLLADKKVVGHGECSWREFYISNVGFLGIVIMLSLLVGSQLV